MEYFLFALIVVFIAKRFLEGTVADKTQEARDSAKVQMYRDAVVRNKESASIRESLGDALRESGRYADALNAYLAAKSLIAEHGGGVGTVSGGGIDNKIRLTEMDIKEEVERPRSYAAQLTQRESICRRCAHLNPADASHCVQCGLDLPVNTFIETWQRDDIRQPILRELREGAVIVAVLLLALYLASWMPLDVKGALLIATIIVLAWKGLRAITDK